MKATIIKNGTLLISPENDTEMFALECFVEKALIHTHDMARNENCYWLGSKIKITLPTGTLITNPALD